MLISKKEIRNTMEVINYLEDSGLLNKSAVKSPENKVKEQKEGFLMLLATWGATLLADSIG